MLQGEALKGVANGMSEVQGLADALLQRVFGDDTLLHGDTVGHHRLQLL